MKRLLLALLAAVLSATPLAAETPPSALEAPPYERVYDVVGPGMDHDVALDRALSELGARMARDPGSAELEAQHPGLLAALQEATRPIIDASSKRMVAEYRRRVMSILRDNLSLEEATEIADFYASPLGRRLLTAYSSFDRAGTGVGAAIDQQPVTGTDVQADLEAAGAATGGGLSEAEQEQVIREFVARPALLKLNSLFPEIFEVLVDVQSKGLTAEEQEALDTAVESVIAPLRNPAQGS